MKKLATLYSILPEQHKNRLFLMILFTTVNSILDLLGIGLIVPAISSVLKPELFLDFLPEPLQFLSNYAPFKLALTVSITVLLVLLVKNLISIWIHREIGRFVFSVFNDLSDELVSKHLDSDFLELNSKNPHTVIRDFYNIPQIFALKIMNPLVVLVSEVFIVVFISCFLFWLSPMVISGILVFVLPIFLALYIALRKRVFHLNNSINEMSPKIWDTFFDLIYGFIEVVLYGKLSFFKKTSSGNIKVMQQLLAKKYVIDILPPKLIEFAMVLCIVIVLLIGIQIYPNQEELYVVLGLFGLATFRLLPSLNRIMIAILDIRGNIYSVEIISEQLTNSGDVNRKKKHEELVVPFKFEELILKDVSFSFKEESDNILNALNLSIRSGESIGFIGKSGSGKTTLFNLILGFYHPQNGVVSVNGSPIHHMLPAWRRHLGYVKQEVYIQDSSLAFNIAFGEKEIDQERLKKAIKFAALEEFISNLPEKELTKVGNKGSALSGGQKQRIGIARALYHGADVFLFDEATSALDVDTEKEIMNAIEVLVQNKFTVIIIAHRHTTLRHCQVIYDLDNGNIVNEYSFNELLK